MTRYRNKLVYDASTGEVKDDQKSDVNAWKTSGCLAGRVVEVQRSATLGGGQNLR